MRPRALTGPKRDRALALLAAGTSYRQIARELGCGEASVRRLLEREQKARGVRATVARTSAPQRAGAPARVPPPVAPPGEAPTVDAILADDVRLRVEMRDILGRMLDLAADQADSIAAARLTAELNRTLDGLRRVVAGAGPVDQGDDEDGETDSFDAMMMRLVDKARRIATSPALQTAVDAATASALAAGFGDDEEPAARRVEH